MSLAKRIIPKIDIKGPNLVKGINLEGLRVLGKPENFAKYYYESGADELIFQDVVASLYGRNSLFDIIKKTADEIFIPLTVGGGIRNINDIKSILRAGADKVSINTAAHENPKLISEASNIFGSSTIVVCIEAIKQSNGEYFAFTDNGRNGTNKEVRDWSKYMEKLGAGEILIVSVDRDGTGMGIDENLIKYLCDSVQIPIIVSGGVGNTGHVTKTLKNFDISGLAISSSLHYEYALKEDGLDNKFSEGNTNYLSNKRPISNIEQINLVDLKKLLINEKIIIRY